MLITGRRRASSSESIESTMAYGFNAHAGTRNIRAFRRMGEATVNDF